MDQVKAMKVFVRIYERSSFTLAADDLNLPRATLTHTLNQFEAWLGTRLLERSTRRVRPTLDGEAYYLRCVQLLALPCRNSSVATGPGATALTVMRRPRISLANTWVRDSTAALLAMYTA